MKLKCLRAKKTRALSSIHLLLLCTAAYSSISTSCLYHSIPLKWNRNTEENEILENLFLLNFGFVSFVYFVRLVCVFFCIFFFLYFILSIIMGVFDFVSHQGSGKCVFYIYFFFLIFILIRVFYFICSFVYIPLCTILFFSFSSSLFGRLPSAGFFFFLLGSIVVCIFFQISNLSAIAVQYFEWTYICRCPAGFKMSGTQCINENECIWNPCQNGGRCVDLNPPRKYECKCPFGYTGMNCELELLASGVLTPSRDFLIAIIICATTLICKYTLHTFCNKRTNK